MLWVHGQPGRAENPPDDDFSNNYYLPQDVGSRSSQPITQTIMDQI